MTIEKLNQAILTITATFILSLTVSAQIGVGRLKGFVSTGIGNSSDVIIAKVELKTIENWANNNFTSTVETKNGYYYFEVSFGYYLLTISADGYKAYQTKVYMPSSSSLEWSTLLEKKDTTPKDSKKK